MTLVDTLRHVAADPLRLIAVRHSWSPPLHTHGVGLLTDGRLVAKAKDGMSSAPYTATLADLIADDWDPLPLAGGGGERAPAAGLPNVERPPTGGGIIGQAGVRPGGPALGRGNSGIGL